MYVDLVLPLRHNAAHYVKKPILMGGDNSALLSNVLILLGTVKYRGLRSADLKPCDLATARGEVEAGR